MIKIFLCLHSKGLDDISFAAREIKNTVVCQKK